MDRKTNEIYNALLEYIKENIFDMDPALFVTDYEQGMRAAINSVFPRVKTVGCWLVLKYVFSVNQLEMNNTLLN